MPLAVLVALIPFFLQAIIGTVLDPQKIIISYFSQFAVYLIILIGAYITRLWFPSALDSFLYSVSIGTAVLGMEFVRSEFDRSKYGFLIWLLSICIVFVTINIIV